MRRVRPWLFLSLPCWRSSVIQRPLAQSLNPPTFRRSRPSYTLPADVRLTFAGDSPVPLAKIAFMPLCSYNTENGIHVTNVQSFRFSHLQKNIDRFP